MTRTNVGKCAECGQTDFLTRDHFIPQLFFKIAEYYREYVKLPYEMNSPENIRWVCQKCNGYKGCQLRGGEGVKFLKLLREGIDKFEANGGYVPSIHKLHWRRFAEKNNITNAPTK